MELKKTRGNTKLTVRQKNLIRQKATIDLRNARQIHKELELPVTTRQVRRVLHNTQSVQWRKMKSKPQLTSEHKDARMNFSKN
jgi:hypothetical protein